MAAAATEKLSNRKSDVSDLNQFNENEKNRSNGVAVELLKDIRTHEVALAELNALSASRAVYQKNGNLFFRTTVQKATTSEQKRLDLAKTRVQKLNFP